MKKLMTMIAAVATAFGLYAADTLNNTVDFSSASDANPFVPGDSLWAYTTNNVATDILADEVQVKDGALVLATGAKVLARKFATDPVAIGENGLFADMVLDLNGEALDEVPDVTGAKIALFALDGTEVAGLPNETNVYVYAAYGTEGGKALYKLAVDAEEFIGSARRIAVKSYASVVSGDTRAGFLIYSGLASSTTIANVVKVDDVYTLDGDTWVHQQLSDVAGDYLGGLAIEPSFSKWIATSQRSLFVSMDANPMGYNQLASVDFQGRGKITSITLTDDDPGFPPDNATMEIATTDATVTAVEGNGAFLVGDPATGISMPVANVVTATVSTTKGNITITGAVATKVADGKYEFMLEDKGTLTVKGWDAAATVKIGEGEAVPFESLFGENGAIAYVNANGGTLKLAQPVTVANDDAIQFGSNEQAEAQDITLDLNGKTITLDVAAIVNYANLTIIDNGENGAIVAAYTVEEGKPCAIENYGTLTITDGIFTGEVYNDATANIQGGLFDQANNTNEQGAFALEVVAPYEVIDNQAGFWKVQEVQKGTVIFICEKTQLEKEVIGTIGEAAEFPAIDEAGIYTAKEWKNAAGDVVTAVTFAEESQTITATAEIVFDGEGTEDDPYQIATVTDLRKLDAFTRDGLAVLGLCFKQTADIDMADWKDENGAQVAWNGIGPRGISYNQRNNCNKSTTVFRSNYDGDNHKISNLLGDCSSDVKYGGVFSVVQSNVIEKLTLENIAITGASATDGVSKEATYALVGVAYDAQLKNLKTTGTIAANGNYGAIATIASQCVLTDCEQAAYITNINSDHLSQGGFTCYAVGTRYVRCKQTGTVKTVYKQKSGNRTGGLVGANCDDQSGLITAAEKAIIFEDCVATGAVIAGNEAQGANAVDVTVGSVVGDVQNGSVFGVVGTLVARDDMQTVGKSSPASGKDPGTGTGTCGMLAFAQAGETGTIVCNDALTVGQTYKVVAPVNKPTTNTLFTAAGQTLTLDDSAFSIFEGGFAADKEYLAVAQTGAKGDAEITFTCSAVEYAVTFAKGAEGAEGTQTAVPYTIGASVAAPTCAFTYTGYDFVAWTNVTAGGAAIAAGAALDTTVIGGYELTAVWAENAAPTPIPHDDKIEYTGIKADNADAACDKVEIKSPDTTVVDDATYAGYFTKSAELTGDGVYTVTATLKPEIVKAAEETKAVADELSDIAAATGDTEITIPAAKVKAGLWYSLNQGQALGAREEGTRVQATSEGVTLTAEHYDGSGFYQIMVNTVPVLK